MGLFNRKKIPLNWGGDHRFAEQFAAAVHYGQRRLAAYLNSKLGEADPRVLLVLLTALGILLGVYFISLILKPFLS